MTMRRHMRFLTPLLFVLVPSGCTRAPSVDVIGSFFPAWLVCFIVAIVLTSLVRWALSRLQMKVELPVLLYPSLAAFFTFALWLVFFY
jgi:hypothetical protein